MYMLYMHMFYIYDTDMHIIRCYEKQSVKMEVYNVL